MSKLTKRFVESIKPDLNTTIKMWDSELKGFGIVVLPSGRKTYCVQYRNQDRVKKRFKIGVHGQISTEMAREMARKFLGQVAQGGDPATHKKERSEAPSMQDLFEEYLKGHATKKRDRSTKEDKRLFNELIAPHMKSKKLETITRKDVEQLHTELSKTPYQANRVLSLLSKMFSLAISWGWIPENPTQGITRYQEEKRTRWLDGDELKCFWNVLDRYPAQTSALLLKFLLLTGARKGEALNATWDQFDLVSGVWTKPSHLTKQKRTEHLPLSTQALILLSELKKLSDGKSTYVFPGKVSGQPLKEIKTFWKTSLKEAGIKNLRIHDLRHTHASHLVSSGLSLSIVGKLLGHTQASTTQRYAHLADEPLRQAAEIFGQKVTNG